MTAEPIAEAEITEYPAPPVLTVQLPEHSIQEVEAFVRQVDGAWLPNDALSVARLRDDETGGEFVPSIYIVDAQGRPLVGVMLIAELTECEMCHGEGSVESDEAPEELVKCRDCAGAGRVALP